MYFTVFCYYLQLLNVAPTSKLGTETHASALLECEA